MAPYLRIAFSTSLRHLEDKRMFNKIRVIRLCIAAIILVGIISMTTAQGEINPCANSVFAEASVYLSTSMVADFTASTRLICPSIIVSSCTLQRKVNGYWVNAGSLTPPTSTAYNTSDFGAQKDYSGSCTKGYTYRIYAVFSACGETVSRYSNEAIYR